jgi:predicted transcriptional regulator of viral defense system
MKFADFLAIVGSEVLIESDLLMAGNVDPRYIRRQLSDWVRQCKLIQLRRGLYMFAAPYRSSTPHPFLVANKLERGSYVSLQSALSYHGLVPEFGASTVTSVSLGRTVVHENPFGRFQYRHVKHVLHRGYRRETVAVNQEALVASPTKALVDLLYLTDGADRPGYLEELRLQGLDGIDLRQFEDLWGEGQRHKLRRLSRGLRRIQALDNDYERIA